MATILIVDDSAVERSLAGGLLRGLPDFVMEYAENGEEALKLIRRAPPTLVLTDLVMPRMDGLQLLRAVRQCFPQIPVILMTAHGNEEIAAEALRQGAVSYVPKSRRSATLRQAIRQVLERVDAVQTRQRLDQCLHHIESTYILDSDASLLKPLLDKVESTLASIGLSDENQQVRVGIALEEALRNALYHGNLGIEGSTHDDSLPFEDREQVAQYRRRESPYCYRKITFKMMVTRERAQFVIRDEGRGCRAFVWQPNRNPRDVFEKGQHRGTALMRYLMDEVQYNDTGNEVKLSVQCAATN